jgi:hypothetical protein
LLTSLLSLGGQTLYFTTRTLILPCNNWFIKVNKSFDFQVFLSMIDLELFKYWTINRLNFEKFVSRYTIWMGSLKFETVSIYIYTHECSMWIYITTVFVRVAYCLINLKLKRFLKTYYKPYTYMVIKESI